MGSALPLMISGTITDASGRTLSGQTPTAFWYSVRHARPWSVGLNCALGAAAMRPHLAELSGVAETQICAYPNAGAAQCVLANMTRVRWIPRPQVARISPAKVWSISSAAAVARRPDHIRAIAEAVASTRHERCLNMHERLLRLSGLEPFTLTADIPFVNVGRAHQCHRLSARFRKLITNRDYATALEVARDQVENGAQIIDVEHGRGTDRQPRRDGRSF